MDSNFTILPEIFQPELAKLCADLSNLAYENPEKCKSELSAYNDLKFIDLIENKTGHALVIEWNDHYIVAFRGTGFSKFDIASIENNFEIDDIDIKQLDLLSGYYGCWTDIADRVSDCIKDKPIILTGHSQGGAVASIAHLIIYPLVTYTFGSPRIVKQKLSISNLHRVVCGYEIPHHWPIFYNHVGSLTRLSPNTKFIASLILDHFTNAYRKAISLLLI